MVAATKTVKTTKVYNSILKAFGEGKRGILLEGGTYSTKCLGRGTKVIMADLTLKVVEDIAIGDTLMGIDGTPRTVWHLYSGRDELFKIKQARGIDYVVNSNHILSLRENWKEIRKSVPNPGGNTRQRRQYIGHTNTLEVTNIPLPEYLNTSNKWKRRHKGWKLAGVELPEQPVAVAPYFLGLWLGDGTRGNTHITSADEVIIYGNYPLITGKLSQHT